MQHCKGLYVLELEKDTLGQGIALRVSNTDLYLTKASFRRDTLAYTLTLACKPIAINNNIILNKIPYIFFEKKRDFFFGRRGMIKRERRSEGKLLWSSLGGMKLGLFAGSSLLTYRSESYFSVKTAPKNNLFLSCFEEFLSLKYKISINETVKIALVQIENIRNTNSYKEDDFCYDPETYKNISNLVTLSLKLSINIVGESSRNNTLYSLPIPDT